ncbi:MAG: hypothetical protein ABIS86_11485, partial [Streptosporangiaceae bacterium]
TDLEAARQTLSGITIKDEELRADPQTQTRLICEYLELPWQLEMIYQNPQYVERAPVVPGTAELPEQLRDLAKLWGYPA